MIKSHNKPSHCATQHATICVMFIVMNMNTQREETRGEKGRGEKGRGKRRGRGKERESERGKHKRKDK